MRLGRLRWACAGQGRLGLRTGLRMAMLLRVCAALCLCAALCGLLLSSACAEDAAQAAADPVADAAMHSISAVLPVTGGSLTVHAAWLDGEPWLFLPTHADMQRLRLVIDGALQEPVDWTALATETDEGVYSAPIPGLPDVTLCVMHSKNLRALYLVSDDPVNEGRAWLEDCEDHERSTTAQMALISQDGSVDHAGAIDKLRGRGNSTWSIEKRPYQFKLSRKADLLDTGDVREQARRWVLLSDSYDHTLLHNRITFDLAHALGMTDTPHSEHIDLYYDGEYRGAYLLCEKVEVGKGRVDIVDYDKLIERWNAAAGIDDPDSLPVAEGTNRYGCTYTYIDGLVDNGDPQSGGYLLEMDNPKITLSDRCWFKLGDGSTIALKNPENASESMMRFISEKLEEARLCLLEAMLEGTPGDIGQYFDVDAFVRVALLNELSCNIDGFVYSSSFFVLDAGETRFSPGPVWDFDLAYRYSPNGENAHGIGYKKLTGWLPNFYADPVFFARMGELFTETLLPLLRDGLLGDGQGFASLADYTAQLDASRRMNDRIHPIRSCYDLVVYGDTYEQDMALFRQFLTERSAWLKGVFAPHDGAEVSAVTLTLDLVYTLTDEDPLLRSADADTGVRAYAVAMERPADESRYARWRGGAVLEPASGMRFANDVRITLNGTPMRGISRSDGSVVVCFAFDDPSYRPIDYEGEDMGLVFDPDWYAQAYPEIVADLGDDPQALLAFFVEEGMYEAQPGNAFFDPQALLVLMPELNDSLGEDWPQYYFEFLYAGYADWMGMLDKRYQPVVTDVSPQS